MFSYFRPAPWRPAIKAFASEDMALPRLIVHVWADWNGHDRTLDTNLAKVRPFFEPAVSFRSVEIDLPESESFCRVAQIVTVTTLGFFIAGEHRQSLVGVRAPVELKATIQAWLEEPSG